MQTSISTSITAVHTRSASTSMARLKAVLLPSILVTIGVMLSGCSNVEVPALDNWVKPYEKSALEDPSMARVDNPIADQIQRGARSRTEGARFKQFTIGEGCAC